MKSRIRCILSATALLASLAIASTPVTGSSTISQVNYNEDGSVNGFVITGATLPATTGTILLEFPRICGTVASLSDGGADAVTFTGNARTDSDGITTVRVTVYSNTTTSVNMVLATSTKSAYTSTAGTIGALNYDSSGDVNGFFWTSTTPALPAVLVISGDEAYEKAMGMISQVAGTSETSSCPGTIPVVEASSLNGTIHVHGHH
jgi:hypothetical protein